MGAGPGGPQDVTRAPKRHADGRTGRRRCTFFQGESLQLSLPPRVLGPWLGHCAGPLPALSVDQGINGCSVLRREGISPRVGGGGVLQGGREQPRCAQDPEGLPAPLVLGSGCAMLDRELGGGAGRSRGGSRGGGGRSGGAEGSMEDLSTPSLGLPGPLPGSQGSFCVSRCHHPDTFPDNSCLGGGTARPG